MNSLMSILMSASSLPNMNSARALASSVLPTPVGPRKMNEPMGRLGSFEPGAGAAHGLGDGVDGLVLADDALVQRVLHLQQALRLLLRDARDRDAGPHGHDLGDVLVGHDGASAACAACQSLRSWSMLARAARSRASRSSAARSYSWSLTAASFSLAMRSSSFCARPCSSGGAELCTGARGWRPRRSGRSPCRAGSGR